MAYLYRLIVFLGCLFLLSPAANASFQSTGSFYIIGFGGTTASTRTASCVLAQGANAYVSQAGTAWSCYNQYGGGGYGVATNNESCPANSTLSNGLCTCAPTYTENAGTCVPPPVNNCTAKAGTSAGVWTGVAEIRNGSPLGIYNFCDVSASSGDPAKPGCNITGNVDFAAGTPQRFSASFTYTGSKCAPVPNANPNGGTGDGAAPDSTQAPTTCPPGKLPGTVNGVTVCVTAGSTDPVQRSDTASKTTTNPDGSTTQTQQQTSTNCSGAGSCTTTTTTTTTTTPAGGGTPTTSTTSTTGTCQRNAPGCAPEQKDERSSFGGTCGAAFVCDGDAVMCSVALEQHRRNCALFVDASPESDLYNTEKGKTGTQFQNENVSLGAGNFNQSNALGAGAQCIQDRNITVMGRLVVLPFSIICNTLQHFGTILIFISFLLAYRIVSRG